MLFDTSPKESPEDFYDMEAELASLKGSLLDPHVRMTVVLGLRRTGKTSLVKVALGTLGQPYVYLDARRYWGSEDYLVDMLEDALSEALRRLRGYRDFFKRALGRVSGVSIGGLSVSLRTGDARRVLPSLLAAVNSEAERRGLLFVLAFDEAQEFASVKWISKLFAYCYDNLRSVKLLLAGSEVRLLEDLIGAENPSSPLYGRPLHTVSVGRLSRERSLDFLRCGFSQVGLRVGEDALERAVSELDGIIGWLTYFGWYTWRLGSPERGLAKTIEVAAELVRSEIERFLARRVEARKRYVTILRALSVKPLTWSEVHRYLEISLGKKIPQNQLSKYLHALIKYGFIEKTESGYAVPDPLLKYAVKGLR